MNKQLPWFNYPSFTWKNKHAIVIGAGIAGCQITWHLAKQDWKITVIEREEQIAQQASGNPAGIISPKMTAQKSTGEDFYTHCFDYSTQQLNSLKEKHENLDWNPCGLLQLAHNPREEKRWDSLKERLLNKQLTSDFLQTLNQQESTHIAGIPIDFKASYFPQAGWIDPVSFCQTLLADVTDSHQLITNCDLISLNKSGSHWEVFDHQEQVIASADVVVNTSGKDLNQFTQMQQLPSMPVLGQTTTSEANKFSSQLKTTIGHEGYLTPQSSHTSQLTFGASFDRNFDKSKSIEKSSAVDQKNLTQLHKYLPQLANAFEHIDSAHVAVRMTTPDRFPYVGGIADKAFYAENYHDLHQGKHYKNYPDGEYQSGLFVLAGLGSRGLTTSGLCAKVLSDILTNQGEENEDRQFISENCHPARFIVKDLKRNKKV